MTVVLPIPEETEVQVVKVTGTLEMSKFTSLFNGRTRISTYVLSALSGTQSALVEMSKVTLQ